MTTLEEELITIRTGADARGFKYAAKDFLYDKYGKAAILKILNVERVVGLRDRGYPVVLATYELDHEKAMKRYVVGRVDGSDEPQWFDTLEEVHAYQATVPQNDLVNGEYYLTDMEETDA